MQSTIRRDAPSLAGPKTGSQAVKADSMGGFFEEKFFWNKANIGPFCLLLFFTPTIYRSTKDAYWTQALKKLNTEEVIADRHEWLRLNMIKDEVEATVLQSAK